MKLKKVTALACAMLMTVSTLAMPVSAAVQQTENFHVYINGGSVVSSKKATKGDTLGYMSIILNKRAGTTVNWVSTEKVNLRGRTASGAQCTTLATRTTAGTSRPTYNSGHGKKGTDYKLAVQYDSSNPYTHLDLTATWIP